MTRFYRRAGDKGFEWGGVYQEGDPSSNPLNQPRDLENAVFGGGTIQPRPGQAKLFAGALSGTLCNGIFDSGSLTGEGVDPAPPTSSGGPALICGVSVAGAGGVGGGTGPIIYWTNGEITNGTGALFYDDEKPPLEGGVEQIFRLPPWVGTLAGGNPKTQGVRQALPAYYNGKIHVGAYQALTASEPTFFHIFTATPPRGDIRYPLERTIVVPVGGTISAASRWGEVRSMAVWRGYLYVSTGVRNTSGFDDLTLWKWNGLAMTQVETQQIATGAIDQRGYMIYPFRDAMIMARNHSAGTQDGDNIIRRVPVSGASADLGMPAAGFAAAFVQPMAEYKGTLYILGHDFSAPNNRVVIYSYTSGASVSLARALDANVAGTASTAGNLGCLFVFNNYLYYTWRNTAGTYYLGRYDGTTFDDTHKALALDAPWTIVASPHSMHEYKGDLVLGLTAAGFLRSNGTTTTTLTHIGDTLSAGGAGTACDETYHAIVV